MQARYSPSEVTKKDQLKAAGALPKRKPDAAYWFSGTIASVRTVAMEPILNLALPNGIKIEARLLPRLRALFQLAHPETYLGCLVVGKYVLQEAPLCQETATKATAQFQMVTLLQFIDRVECKAYQVEEWFGGESNPSALPAIDYNRLWFCSHGQIRIEERNINITPEQMRSVSGAIKHALLEGKARITVAVDKEFILIIGVYGCVLITALPYTEALVEETKINRPRYLYIVDSRSWTS